MERPIPSQLVSDSAPPNRAFVAIGVAKPGRASGFPELPGVPADLERLRALFVDELGYAPVALTGTAGNLDLSADEIRSGLVAWRERSRAEPCDAVVVYFSGHADVHGQDLLLCTRGTVDGVPGSALDVRAIGQCLDGAAAKIWIILDVCYASAGVDALASLVGRAAQEEGRALWFLASSGGRVRSYDGMFSAAFERAARSAPAPFETFRAALQRELDAQPARQHAQAVAALNRDFDLLLPAGAVHASAPRTPARAAAMRKPWPWLVSSVALAALLAAGAALGLSRRPGADSMAVASTGVPFDVAVLTERADELVAITASEPLRSGELFAFHVKLPEAAYLGILHWSSEGRPEQLYPDGDRARLLRVEPQARSRVPPQSEGDIELDAHIGVERFALFASDVPALDLDASAIAAELHARLAWPSGWDEPAQPPAQAAAPSARVNVRGAFFRPREQRTGATHIIAASLIELEHVK